MDDSPAFSAWISALDDRHLANLTLSEVGRALRALSSCYVERRDRLAEGAALEGAGKRAAFALFYAPLHFLAVAHVIEHLPAGPPVRSITDLGCGTGAAGAAWALAAGGARLAGYDRSPWAVAEANWSYARLGLRGRAVQRDVTRVTLPAEPGDGILAAYTVNELGDAARAALLPRLLDAAARGALVLIVEPIARRIAPWWASWESAFTAAGGHAAEWRFASRLPARQRQLAKGAGLDPQQLTARTLLLAGDAGSRPGSLR